MAERYTPHGYLNLKGHARNLNPKGVLRSSGLGFAWHYPNHASGYGHRREHYRTALEFDVGSPPTCCDVHTMNVKRFLVESEGTLRATFFPDGDDALHARLESDVDRTLIARLHCRRLLSPLGEWGESGLIVRPDAHGYLLQAFEDGPAFHLRANAPITAATARGADDAVDLRDEPFMTVTGRRGEEVEALLELRFELRAGEVLWCSLGRGLNAEEARTQSAAAHARREETLAALTAQDATFQQSAPVLEGEWPDHWRRGLHYDLQTLRMMVKEPIGRYRHRWDAMQIQAPRVVLAEAAMDALCLAYADPVSAQEMLLGLFRDAEAPNVPCSREDGSLNMVAADGTPCGTGPQWGYPFLAVSLMYDLHPDPAWLKGLYPYLTSYFQWWQNERRTPWGTLGFACSWESGQDDSPRFGPQPLGGGHPVRYIVPVDLYTAMAHGAATLQRLATVLGHNQDALSWEASARHYSEACRALFNGERYADRDARSGTWTDIDDVMLCSPYALGVAPTEHQEAGRTALAALDPQGGVWPMFLWTEVLAAEHLGRDDLAANFARNVIERTYRFWDAWEADPLRTLPGVSCEYWPQHGRCGGEGYGWGAFLVHILLHHLVGYRPTATALRVRPNLPEAWRDGRQLRVRLNHHGTSLRLQLSGGRDRCQLSVNGLSHTLAWGEALTLTDETLPGVVHDRDPAR